MRPLLLLVCLLVFVETMLYSALVPLLPGYAHEFGLSKTAAGLLVGAYAAGAVLGALPGGIAAARWGPRRALLFGLAIMGLASLAFGFAGNAGSLGLARRAHVACRRHSARTARGDAGTRDRVGDLRRLARSRDRRARAPCRA